MKQIINDYYIEPYPKDFKEHFRKGLNSEYVTIFDSISNYRGDSRFHYDNTMIPPERFEKLLRNMVRSHMDEMIRLAIIGFRHEKNGKPTDNQQC